MCSSDLSVVLRSENRLFYQALTSHDRLYGPATVVLTISIWPLPCDADNNNSTTKEAINIAITGERLPWCVDSFASGFDLVIPKSRFLKKLCSLDKYIEL